jgi:hypothetical protein
VQLLNSIDISSSPYTTFRIRSKVEARPGVQSQVQHRIISRGNRTCRQNLKTIDVARGVRTGHCWHCRLVFPNFFPRSSIPRPRFEVATVGCVPRNPQETDWQSCRVAACHFKFHPVQPANYEYILWEKNVRETHLHPAFRLHQLANNYFDYVMRHDYSSPGRTGSISTTLCVATTHLLVAPALLQPCRAPWLLVSRSHRLYFNHVVCRDYSSPDRTGSTSTTSCVATTRLLTAYALPQLCRVLRLLVYQSHSLYLNYAVRRRDIVLRPYHLYFDNVVRRCDIIFWPHRLYFANAVRPVAWSRCSTCYPVALSLLCLRHLFGRMVSRSTCCPVALDLLHLCHAPRLLVSRQHRLYLDYVLRRDY